MKYAIGLGLIAVASLSHADCSLSDIQITSLKAQFVNKCTSTECWYMKGVATLQNNCAEAVGVQIQIVGSDESGSPIASDELWPASTRNIPPGRFVFSVDQYLEYDPSITKFELTAISVQHW